MTRILKVGDILECSWGYDQTNVDFYQVVGLVGKASVSLSKMTSHSKVENGYSPMSDFATPGEAAGKPFTKRELQWDGRPYIKMSSYAHAYLWDRKPAYRSWYA